MAQIPSLTDSQFDYSQFKSQFELHEAFKQLCQTLENQKDAGGQSLFPKSKDGDSVFTDIFKQLRISEPLSAEAESFKFEEFKGKTIEEVEAECKRLGVSMMQMTANRGYRVFYNTTFSTTDTEKWEECSRPEASDIVQENAEVIFVDNVQNIVDWKRTLEN
jgi:hypothetical protein